MAANVRSRTQAYRMPGVVGDNLARKLDNSELQRQLEGSGQLDFDQQYRRSRQSQAEEIAQRRAKARETMRPARRVSPVAVLGFAVAATLLVGLLLCYVEINTISGNIVETKTEIKALEQEQVSLLTAYERAFELSAVQAAAQAAGMAQPADSQITYINLPGQDQAVTYESAKNGVLHSLSAAFSQRFYAVVEYFR